MGVRDGLAWGRKIWCRCKRETDVLSTPLVEVGGVFLVVRVVSQVQYRRKPRMVLHTSRELQEVWLRLRRRKEGSIEMRYNFFIRPRF